jgi:hypothetical protein
MVASEPNQQWRTMVASEKNLEFNAASRQDNGFRLLRVKEKKVSHGKERTKKTNP